MSLARLKDALNRAVTRRVVTVNVASEVHIPLKARKAERKTKAVVMPWNAAEVGAFITAMRGTACTRPKDTKGMAGERMLPLPALVRDALKAFWATRAKERLAAGEGYESGGYVLVDELGDALNGRQLRVRAYKIVDENGLRRVRLYDARASCLTFLANNGVPDHLLACGPGTPT
ncbi:hypothetical protein [Streptomyces laculatispora]|uniref:hypothetical protein n=1 Tax=Streptomyces laculatispora TaxID=887464 RepID=UPI001F5EBD5D|nr:hypothetical protein [Streptomyces laculatispora]